jgi:glutaminyl-peptide cyclotransferase
LNNKLGKNILKATFSVDDKQYIINKEFVIYSSIKPKIYSYKIINEFSHDINSYTQGLEFSNNDFLYEGTGQYGYSMLKKVNYQTGEVLEKLFLDKSYFGEGITILNDKIFQLTWKSKMGFVYNLNDFKLLNSFNYNNSVEGWGLCNDGKYIYKSDGTEKIWKLDSNNLEEIDFVNVVTNNKVINKINELEWFNNKIYANTYQFNKEVGLIINPINGQVEGVIDFSGLKKKVKDHPKLDVLNGIAYNKKRQTFFITGKNWNKLFEIQIVEKKLIK